jgi:hypothetical protein
MLTLSIYRILGRPGNPMNIGKFAASLNQTSGGGDAFT